MSNILKKDKVILLDSYEKLFETYSKSYQEMVSKEDLFGNEKRYEECKTYCEMCDYELLGMVLLLEDAGIFNYKESSEELKKIRKEFDLINLMDLYFGKVEE